MARSATFQLNATRSTGTRPFDYLWSQDAGIAVAFPMVGPSMLASPSLTSPAAATVLKFNLSVREPSGRTSDPVSVLLPVGTAPTPFITQQPPQPVYGGQRIIVSGGTSTSADLTGIVAYEWTLSPVGVATATPLNGGRELQIDLPPVVSVPFTLNVQLHVVNGVTIRSLMPAVAMMSVTTGQMPSWSVDAGPNQAVDGGSLVTLRAGTVVPSGNPNFTYQWSPDSELDAGAFGFVLTPNGPNATFVAPRVDGPTPRTMTFTLTVTDTSGTLQPPSRTETTIVQVWDRRPPVLLGSSIVGGQGGMISATLEFDEELATSPASVNATGPGQAVAVTGTQIIGRKVYLAPRTDVGAMSEGISYVLQPGSTADSAGNAVAFTPLSFTVRNGWTPAFESVGTSTGEPFPGVVVRRLVSGQLEAFVFARRDTSSWFFSPFDPLGCPVGPCSLTDDASAPVIPLTGPRPRGHKGLLGKNGPVATLQLPDNQGTPSVIVERGAGGWTALPTPPGSVFVNGGALNSVGFDAGVVRQFVLDGGAWTPTITVTTNLTEYPTDLATDDPFVYAEPTGLFGTRARLLLKSSRTLNLNNWYDGPPWTTANYALAVDARNTVKSNTSNGGLAVVLRSGGLLETMSYSVGANGGSTLTGSVVTHLDAISNWSSSFVATIIAGQLELWISRNGAALSKVPGPKRNGVPGTVINNDPSCEAARPELAMSEGLLFVTWQERCAAGPWRVYFRALE